MSLAAASLLLLPTIWIVDSSNGPGTHFTDLPAAVAAAQSGDTLLVRSGTYTVFQVAGKALTIRGSGTASTHVTAPGTGVPWVVLGPTPVGGAMVLSGLSVAPVGVPGVNMSIPALEVRAAAVVTLLDAEIVGSNYAATGTATRPDGALVAGTLHAARCRFLGGSGSGSAPAFAGSGVHVLGGSFAGDDCRATGGNALGTIFFGALRAGHGVEVEGGVATLTHTSCMGGSCGSVTRTPGAANGGGLVVTSGFARAAGTQQDAFVAGGYPTGIGGPVQPFPGIAATGGSIVVHGPVSTGGVTGAVTFGPAMPRASMTGALLPSGETDGQQGVVLALDGIPGAPFALLVDVQPEFGLAPFSIVVGELLVPFSAPALFGGLDAAGHYQLSFVPAVVAPQVLGQPLYVQGGTFDGVQVLASSREMRIFAP
jgi:hypothetical protein